MAWFGDELLRQAFPGWLLVILINRECRSSMIPWAKLHSFPFAHQVPPVLSQCLHNCIFCLLPMVLGLLRDFCFNDEKAPWAEGFEEFKWLGRIQTSHFGYQSLTM
mmetsp:Transcript_14834/g.18346  ORF Transcript_14834/g.18346 Transcript_14834/m.18346 type:complete len:106 (+) Transcript_14834:1123-1440(+)